MLARSMDDATRSTSESLEAELGDSLGSVLRAVAATPRAVLPPRLAPGTIIHEAFRIDRILGSGGMGVVYLARDLRLHRDVAIKLHGQPSHDPGARRLWREAEALARLAHTNIVRVYEIGIYGGCVFVVMEYIEGGTVREWLARTPRSWSAVLELFMGAGQGLAAAHAAGLVHRDLKPDNLLVGADGLARVADFGLARAAEPATATEPEPATEPAPEPATEPAPAPEPATEAKPAAEAEPGSAHDRESHGATEPPDSRALAAPMTRTGTLMGTPAYMAPEQHRGSRVDARADQFAFCVALYESLYGQRPYAGDSAAEVYACTERGVLAPAPPRARVPGWVRQVLARGLQPDPDRRYPTMRALLHAIDHKRRIRRRVALVAAAAMLIGAASLMTQRLAPGDARPVCTVPVEALHGVWDAERKQAVHAAFLATGAAYAADTWARVEPVLDRYAAAWLAAHQGACEATYVRGAQSPALLDRQVACLADRARDLGALTGVLARAHAHADDTVLTRAIQAAMSLPSLAGCADVAGLLGQAPEPADPEIAARVAVIRGSLAEARAQRLAGRYAQARATVEPAMAEARALGYAPLEAAAAVTRGELLVEQEQLGAAESELVEAYFLARESAHDELAATAALALSGAVRGRQSRLGESMIWARHGLAGARRHAPGGSLEAKALRAIGIVLWSQSSYDDALAYLAQALAVLERDGGDQLWIMRTLDTMGVVAASMGRLEQALAYHQRSLALAEEVLGPRHPLIAINLGNLALTYNDSGRYGEALPYIERALAVTEAAFGPDSVKAALQRENLAVVELGLRRFDPALHKLRLALAVLEREQGPDHPDVGRCVGNIGEAFMGMKNHGEALAHYQRALASFTGHYGSSHSEVARMTGNVGTALLELGRLDEAAKSLQRAIAIWDETAPGHQWIAPALTALGETRRRQGRAADARPVLERALAVAEAGNLDALAGAWTRFVLARVLWPEPGERPRARALAESAHAVYTEHDAPERDEVSAWLAEHRVGQ